jgi:hypothetical protein
MLMIIADGVWWRRALQRDFDPKSVLAIFMDVTRHMLRGKSATPRVVENKTEEGAR